MAARDFTAYGPSHWAVLAVFVVGAAAIVLFRRHLAAGFGRAFAVVVLALQLAIQVYSVAHFGIDNSLPLQLSDLAGYATAYALWSRRPWAGALVYYWGLTLSTQALVSPALGGADFPSLGFLAFWLIHLLVVWAAIHLIATGALRPTWRDYRRTALITLCWAASMLAFNAIAGTNYGFLNAKPAVRSILDALGPWPWYLLPEVALVLSVWALMTWPWQLRGAGSRAGRRVGSRGRRTAGPGC